MRDGGRIQAAIEVLSDIAERRRPAADALKDWGLSHRFAGSGDRGAISSLVFDALRQRASLSWRMGADTPRAQVLGVYGLVWGKGVDEIDALFAEDRHAPEPLSDEERAALSRGQVDASLADALADAPGHIAADVPEWLWPSFAALFGEDAVAEGRALAGRAPVDLRANRLKAERDKVLSALSRFSPQPTPLSPVGVRIAAPHGPGRTPHLASEAGFLKGWFEVQDEASQLAAILSGARGGAQVLDLCAGGGGKTLAMAAEMGNSGQIFAYDSDARRFGDIRERLKRAGARNVQLRLPSEPDALADLAGRMDVVLVDAPCTGTGTWRRRPDAKWRLAPGALDLRIGEQKAVLGEGADFVAPGGMLVYVTCSLLPQENEEQIVAFLSERPEFRLADPGEQWLTTLGGAMPDGLRAPVEGFGDALRLTPARAGTDGFFVALLRRAA
ncbi:MAG: MFS transporter [Hyphomicrobiales bacterium]|nr:MAG: MFS transporter [Hyphomicrobiales bacterium]